MKKRYIVLIVFILLIGIPLLDNWESLFGNETEAVEGAKKYLKEKYGKEFVIEHHLYQFGSGQARMEAYPAGHPEERFEVMYGAHKKYYEDYPLAHLVIPYLKPLSGMPVLYRYTSSNHYESTVEEDVKEKRYDKLSFSVYFYITDHTRKDEVIKKILEIMRVYKNKLGIGSVGFNVSAPNKEKVKIENKGRAINDFEQFMRDQKGVFEIYCVDEADGEPYQVCQ